jgi:hypothetical protein
MLTAGNTSLRNMGQLKKSSSSNNPENSERFTGTLDLLLSSDMVVKFNCLLQILSLNGYFIMS